MIITDSQLTLGSKHALEETSLRTTTLERVRDPEPSKAFGGVFEQELNKLLAARLDNRAPIRIAPAHSAAERIHDMVETMLAMLFGQHAELSPVALIAPGANAGKAALAPKTAPAAPPRPRWQFTETEQRRETESCQFGASGKVCLADGSQRQFDVGYRFERSESVSRTVSSTMFDPLVIDSLAPRAALAESSVEFDLNNDGTLERMRLPAAGSSFLFLDRNRNGRADNGSELFGPESGDGFAELARLDDDHNGWIDSADAAFADLRLWQVDDAGQQRVRRLDEAGIGALAITAAATPFQLKENGQTVGQMRSSSVWLGETSGAGIIRQVDVSTTPAPDKAA